MSSKPKTWPISQVNNIFVKKTEMLFTVKQTKTQKNRHQKQSKISAK